MIKKLIIVNGAPGTGKTTLTKHIREHFAITVIEKDAIKEFFFDYVGVGDREWSKALGKASIDALFVLADLLLHIKNELLIETAFYAELTKLDIARLLENREAEILEIYCRTDEAVRRQRFEARAKLNRHPGHADLVVPSEVSENLDRYEPMQIGQFIEVDTTNFDILKDSDQLLQKIAAFLERG